MIQLPLKVTHLSTVALRTKPSIHECPEDILYPNPNNMKGVHVVELFSFSVGESGIIFNGLEILLCRIYLGEVHQSIQKKCSWMVVSFKMILSLPPNSPLSLI
jgi:hypothetical protein